MLQLKGMSEVQAETALRSLALYHSFAWGRDADFEQGGKWSWLMHAPDAVPYRTQLLTLTLTISRSY